MFSIDLHDAYFQVPVHRESRPYPRFCFEGHVYQFKALCFGLSTAPQVFTRVSDLVSERTHQRGVRRLHYLDACLVITESWDLLLRHQDLLLHLCADLGIVVNWKRSDFVPSTCLQYLGVVIDTSHERVFTLQGGSHIVSPPSFSTTAYVAAATQPYVVAGAFFPGVMHLHVTPSVADEGQLIASGRRSSQLNPPVSGLYGGSQMVASGGPLGAGGISTLSAPSLSLYTDTSLSGWRALLLDSTALGVWSEEQSQKHINVVEIRAVELALASFLPQLAGQCLVLMSNNASVVAYLWHQGGTVSRRLCLMASVIGLWTEWHLIYLEAHYIPGKKKNILADQLNCPDQILPTEWSLLPCVFDGICQVFGCPHLDLFTTRVNTKLPLNVSPVPDPIAWKQDALHLPWNHLVAYTFPPFILLRQVIS